MYWTDLKMHIGILINFEENFRLQQMSQLYIYLRMTSVLNGIHKEIRLIETKSI